MRWFKAKEKERDKCWNLVKDNLSLFLSFDITPKPTIENTQNTKSLKALIHHTLENNKMTMRKICITKSASSIKRKKIRI